MGIDDYLTVPFDRLDLKVKVKNLVKLSHSKPDNENLKNLSTDNAAIPGINQLLNKFNKSFLSNIIL